MSLGGEVWAAISLVFLMLLFVVFGISIWRRELADNLLYLLLFLFFLCSIPAIIVSIIRSLPLITTVMSIFMAGLLLLLGFASISGVIQRRPNATLRRGNSDRADS